MNIIGIVARRYYRRARRPVLARRERNTRLDGWTRGYRWEVRYAGNGRFAYTFHGRYAASMHGGYLTPHDAARAARRRARKY